jgi:hypothetical protein
MAISLAEDMKKGMPEEDFMKRHPLLSLETLQSKDLMPTVNFNKSQVSTFFCMGS